MICLVLPLLIGFGIDCVLGDPHSLPHPVVLIGKTISALECVLRRIFPKTPRGERAAGGGLNHLNDGDAVLAGVAFAGVAEHRCGGGVAGDDEHFHAGVDEFIHDA